MRRAGCWFGGGDTNPGGVAPWGQGKALGRQKASDLVGGVLDGFFPTLFSFFCLVLFADTR